jgi:hypothetical protein
MSPAPSGTTAPLAFDDLIITAASESYTSQLLSFLGSLHCNWPDHPPVLVYDLGLAPATIQSIQAAGFHVRMIPPFAPHWRQHYTWKLWCLQDAPAKRVLWLDAGCCVLRPCPEILQIVSQQGYFGLPNHRPLELEASEAACEGCGVSPDFRKNKIVVTAAVFGFLRGTVGETAVNEAYQVGLTERFIRATRPEHRWEQAILSLQLYKLIHPLVLCDAATYFFEDLQARFTTHRIWAARRNMHMRDRRFFAASLEGPAKPHRPRASHKLTLWYRVAWQTKVALDGAKNLLKPGPKVSDGVK